MTGYFYSIFLSTFVLEDVALATSIGLVADGKLKIHDAFLACFLGIAVGDIGLYLIGLAVSRPQIEKIFPFLKKYRKSLAGVKKSQVFTYSIVISRMIPGTRLPTYIGAGFLRYSFLKFFSLTLASVFVWVFLALFAGSFLNYIFMDHWVATIAAFLVALQFFKSVIPKLFDFWDRKAFLHSWRKWTHFEFWPAWFFYLPIVPYYLFLSLKYRSFLTPFYACPDMVHGGLIGESKWDFFKYLSHEDSSTLQAFKIKKTHDFIEVRKLLEREKIEYPFVMKPDVGQRGFGVRIIRNDFDLTEYLLLSDFEVIIQRLSLLPMEAGIFYVRKPSEKMGFLFSITDKRFPTVVGDGESRLGDLILKDKRARIIAPVYFERHRDELNSVPELGEIYYLADCGNHCQGAIFMNGSHLKTAALTERIDQIAKQIPGFYFGRFDVRYLDQNSIKTGENFEIVEINGSGSEATHIWDAKTTLREAYKTLYSQWALLFEIGSAVRKTTGKNAQISIYAFLKECLRVSFRKEPLSISS